MIEELCEFLVRFGWSEDVANHAHNAYYNNGIKGVKEYIKNFPLEIKTFMNTNIRELQEEVGETDKNKKYNKGIKPKIYAIYNK